MNKYTVRIIPALFLLVTRLCAGPTGGEVSSGTASISQEGGNTTIQQSSGSAVINWQGFDINASERVQFLQPGSSAATLNRITGGGKTQINGQLLANGRIFIVNGRGVVFGSGAQVDVGALLATTGNISDSRFMSGDYRFGADEGGAVINYGNIRVDGNGFVFLVAPTVENHGSIVASAGSVGLHASGKAFTLDFQGDGLVRYVVSDENEDSISSADGEDASGSTVVLPSDTGYDVVTSVVNSEGVDEADSMEERDGVVLLQSEIGTAWNTGLIDVSATEGDVAGGLVQISGHFAGSDGDIQASGSGTGAGGLVLVSSDRHSLVTSDARIDVSGGQSGSGGSVLLRSDNRSTFHGNVTAQGGSVAGDGGFVDVSSLGQVELTGIVDASAARGMQGLLLIDPKNIDVNNTGGVAYNGGVNNQFNDNAAGDTVISAASINSQIADVLLQANTDITVTDAIIMANAGVGISLQAGRSVLLNNSITTLNGDVVITGNDVNAVALQRDAGQAQITMAGGTAISAGAGNIDLLLDSTGHGAVGTISLQTLAGGALTVTADNDVTFNGTVNASTVDVDAGRAVGINADMTASAAVNITANNSGADAAQHLGGVGDIAFAAGTVLDAGNANIHLTVDGAGHGDAGGVTLDQITTSGNVTIDSYGAITEVDVDSGVDVRGDIVSLNTADPNGASIGSPGTDSTDSLEVEVGTRLDMTTQGGYAAVHRPDHTELAWRPVDDPFTLDVDESQYIDFGLGTVNLGAANLILTVTDGSLLDANAGAGAANITAIGATLRTDGGEDIINSGTVIGNDGVRGGSIGTALNPLRTDLDILAALSTHDSIFITEADEIILSSVHAQQEGVSAKPGSSGVVVRNLRGVNLAGVNNVTVTAGGSIGVDVVTATDTVTLNSSGSLIDNNAQQVNITAPVVVLNGSDGIGQQPMSEGLALDVATDALSAQTVNGGIFLVNNLPGTSDILSLIANGGHDIEVSNTQGILRMGEITANGGGNVTVDAGGGSIVDGNAAAVNITGADVSIISSFDVGSDLDAIETTASSLMVELVEDGSALHVVETDGLDDISAIVNNGDVNLTFTGGTFGFDSASDLFTSTGADNIYFENTGGDIAVNTVTATTEVEIRSSGAITYSASQITAQDLVLGAETGIGSSGVEIQTAVDALIAETRNGGIYLREDDAITATAVAAGTGGEVDLATGNGGDLMVVRISANGPVTLDAAGNLVGGPQTGPVRGSSATLTAGGAIGSSASALTTRVGTLAATANGGGLFVENTGNLVLTSGTATGDDLLLRTTGTLNLGTLTAVGQTVTLHSNGAMTDGNAAALNIDADQLTISSGGGIGGPGADEAVDIDVASLTVPSTQGAVYLNQVGGGDLALVTAEVVGSDAHFILNAVGNILLGSVVADGDDVRIISGGEITDANGTDLNIKSDALTIEAPGGIAVADALETQVNELSSTGNAIISNSGPLALTEQSLEGGSSSFIADNITILDIGDDIATLLPNVSLSLITPDGNIVFLDTDDTIVASGTGSVTIDAGSSTPGSDAVAILGNIETENQNITVSADLHITIGLLDAGSGDVSVRSNNGVILDGNGSQVNIIADNVSLQASLPTEREAELHTINSIADAHAEESEAEALAILLQANEAAAMVLEQSVVTQIMLRDAKEDELDEITVQVDELTDRVEPLAISISVMEQTIQAMTIAADVLNVAGSIAQAIPMTGDGGLLATAAAFETGIGVVDKALYYVQLAYDILAEDLADLEVEQAALAAQLYTHQQLTDAVVESSNAANEALSISAAGHEAALVSSAQAWQVSDQAILAEDQNNALGTSGQSFGIQASGDINAFVSNSDIFMELDGGGTLANVSAVNPAGDARVMVESDADIHVSGTVSGQRLVRMETSGGAVINDGGLVTASDFLALTATGVGIDGTASGGLAASVDEFAAHGGSGQILLVNDNALVIGTVDGVNGLTADGRIAVEASGPLTVSQDVTSQGDVELVAADDNAQDVNHLKAAVLLQAVTCILEARRYD